MRCLPNKLMPAVALAAMFLLASEAATARTLDATPQTYQKLIKGLHAGDTVRLATGTYRHGLRIYNLHGRTEAPIVIEGAPGADPVFIGIPGRNTVSLSDASHITLRGLTLRSNLPGGDAIKAEGFPGCDAVHHVTLERLRISGYGAHQQQVAISTKCNAWDWIIRYNHIEGAGTGMYLGNADGNAPFVRGLIEHNVVRDTLGYNLQIKHQLVRPADVPGMPQDSAATTLRYNLFSKSGPVDPGASARPNVLLGHMPLSGAGVNDEFHVYGNLFLDNPVEALFQGEGNLVLYNNLFLQRLDSGFPALAVQPHNWVPRRVLIFHNTLLAKGTGIRVSWRHPPLEQIITANAVFADLPIRAKGQSKNLTAPYENVAQYLEDPTGRLNQLDLRPNAQTPAPRNNLPTALRALPDMDLDYNGCKTGKPYAGAFARVEGGDGVATLCRGSVWPLRLPATARPDPVQWPAGAENGN